MEPESWRQVKEVLYEALQLAPEQRADFLDRACSSDHSLREKVESLLASVSEGSNALPSSVFGVPLAEGTCLGDATQSVGFPSMIGQVLGHYRILAKIGAGGMGEVYRAHDEQLDRDVALKVLPVGALADETERKQFRKEALALAKMNHPNIATVYEFSTQNGMDVLAMELIPGVSLSEKLKDGPLPNKEIVYLGAQIAEGLALAHQQGIAHRDLKPANIMLTPDRRVKILDFGLARILQPSQGADLTLSISSGTKKVSGTLPYMAPEQLRGELADARSDIYSTGAVLYEMATGQRPFPQTHGPTLMGAILHEAPKPPSSQNPRIHRELEKIILKAIEKEPSRRYQSAHELANDLQRLASGEVPLAARTRIGKVFVSAVLVTLLVSGLSWHLATKLRPTPSFRSSVRRRSVAVLGLRDLGMRPETAWLSSAMAEMLTTELAAGDQLRTISGERVTRMENDLALGKSDSFENDTLLRIRTNLGSDLLVLGSYIDLGGESGGQIRLDLRIQDANSGETLANFIENGTEAGLLDLVSRTGKDLREKVGLGELSPSERARLKASQPVSPEAARLYSEALAKLRLFDALAARDLLDRAIASDPNNPLVHLAQADAWAALGYENRAREEAKQAFELSVNLPPPQRLAIEGRYLEATRDWDKAIKIYQKLFERIPDNIEYGLHLANIQNLASKNRDALATLDVLRKNPSPMAGDPRIDLGEAETSQSVSDFKRELVAAGRAAQKGQAQGARLVLAQARVAEGRAFRGLGEANKAIEASEEARKLFAAVGDRLGEARVLHNMGAVYYDKGNLENARKTFEECRRIRHQIGNRRGEAGDLNDIAVILAHEKDTAAAVNAYEQSLSISREIGDLLNEGVALDNVADLQRLNGNFADARRNFKKALEIDRKIGNLGEAARVLNNLALMLTSEGNLAAARTNLEQALKLNRDLGDKNGIAIALVNLAEIQFNLGELLAAERLYSEAQQIFQSTGASVYSSWPLYGLAEIQFERDDLVGARQKHETALALRQQGGETGAVAESRLALSRLYREQGQFVGARGAAANALEGFRQGGDADGQAKAEIAAALCALEEVKVAEAHRAIDNARKLSGATKDPTLKIELNIADARVQIALGNTSRAPSLLAQSLSQSRNMGFRELEYDTRLAWSELQRRSGRSNDARRSLVALQRDATATGFRFIARKAAAAVGTAQ